MVPIICKYLHSAAKHRQQTTRVRKHMIPLFLSLISHSPRCQPLLYPRQTAPHVPQPLIPFVPTAPARSFSLILIPSPFHSFVFRTFLLHSLVFSKRSVDTTVHLSSQPSGIRFTRSFLNFLFIYINSCNYGRTSSLEVIGNGPIQTIYPLPCISGHFHPSFTFLISRRRVSYHWVIYNKVSGVRRYRKETLKTRLARWGIA